MADTQHEQQQRIVINFIDPLFAVVLNVSFAQIIGEQWFLDFRKIFIVPNLYCVFTLVLGYATLVLSWVGYHQSISKYPIHVDRYWGKVRFVVDVGLLIAYFVLLVSYTNFRRFLWTLAVVYLMFLLWDLSKSREKLPSDLPLVDPNAISRERRAVTVFWLIIHIAFATLYSIVHPVRFKGLDWLFLVLATAFAFAYRRHKNRIWLRPVLKLLAYGPA